VRIGLVGYGMGGRYFHAPLIAAAAGCELAGVVTRSPERRAELAQDAPGVPAYDSLADLAAAGVDAVVVSTPLPTHLPLVREAVGLGLPVVYDKPFAADAVAARATVELAARAGVLLSVYQNRRWDADLLTVSKVLASGALGDIITFESHLEQSPPTAGLPTTGGGVLLDLGAHAVDQAMALFGPVSSVYAELHVLPELDGFDNRFFVAPQRRDLPPVGQLGAAGRAHLAVPRDRQCCHLCGGQRRRPDRSPARRANTGHRGGCVGVGARGQMGADLPRRGRRAGPDRAWLVELVLCRVRLGRARSSGSAGQPLGRRGGT
jgi:predicted dehydrogenase